MKQSIFLLFFIHGLGLFAQNTNYLIHLSDSGSHGPAGMISLSDGSIIIAGTELILGTDPDQKSAFMYKVDENGNLLDEKRITCDSTNILVYDIFKISEDSILITALSKPYHDNNSAPDSILMMTFDINLNLKKRIAFPLTGVNEYWAMHAVLVNQFIYLNLLERSTLWYYLSLHKVDIDADTIYSSYFYTDSIGALRIWDIDYRSIDSTISMVYAHGHPFFDTSQTNYGTKTLISFFDEELHPIGSFDTMMDVYNGVSQITNQMDSSSLFVYGIGLSLEAGPLVPTEQMAKLYKVMLDTDSVQGLDVFYNEDTICYTGLNNIVQLGTDLYCFGFFNAKPIEMPWQYSRTFILLAKLDTGLQIQNIRLVGEDYFYMPYVSCVTSDSNVVVAGTYFDYNAGDERYQVFILKTDQNLSLGIHDQEVLWNNLSVYPNPASNNITLEIPDNNTAGLVYIFNSAGSVVKSVLLEGKQKNIDVSVLASGNYFISFIPKSGQSFSGQFVKE